MRLAIIIGIAILGGACSEKTTATKSPESSTETIESVEAKEDVKPQEVEESMLIDYEKLKFISATVVDVSELDGCGYMLKLENGKKLQPTPALSDEFKVNDLPVWVKFQVKKGAVGICMSGQIVTLTSIARK